MKINKVVIWLLPLWSVYLCYLLLRDVEAAAISLVFTPLFGLIVFGGFKSKNVILRLFVLMGFVAHAIGAPYMWITQYNYTYSGFSAIKDFEFNLVKLFHIYIWVIGLFGLVVVFTLFFDRIRLKLKHIPGYPYQVKNPVAHDFTSNPKIKSRTASSGLLILALISLIAVPLNIYMATNHIGVTGVLSAPLPYRLTGIMYYSRLLFIPLMLAWLYLNSTQGRWLFVLITSYAIFASLSAASRTMLLLSFMPLILGVLFNKQMAKGVVLTIVMGAAFVFVNASRDYTYINANGEFSYVDAVAYAVEFLRDSSNISPMSIVGGVANRFYGAQDMILAYQYEPSSPLTAFFSYFWSGGRADSVVPDLGNDLFGFSFEEGSGFGVGIGIMTYLFMLVRANILLLLPCAATLAILLSIGNRCLSWTFSGNSSTAEAFRFFIAILLAFTIYSSSLNFYYGLIEILVIIGIATRFAIKHRELLDSTIRFYIYKGWRVSI